MRISFVPPQPELQPYVESMWVFESAVGMPSAETSLAAPNACPKLIIPYQNSIVSTASGHTQVSHEHGLYFVGNRDSATLLRSSSQKTGFVAIEFRPHGAYPIFGIPMDETANVLIDAACFFGRWGRSVRENLCNCEKVSQKLDFIQDELVRLLRQGRRDNTLVNYCVRALQISDGRMAIKELEHQTGYSRRYLDLLFNRHVGFSPKVLAGIYRFQKFYRKWAQGLPFDAIKEELYDYYYDQAHFTREFKRITGYSPQKFAVHVSNEFGRRVTLK